jgi:chromosome segregation ATPase
LFFVIHILFANIYIIILEEKLAESSAANAALSSQLENLAPQLSSLERALTDTRSKLDREEKLRRRAEQAQDEAESRLREAEGDLLAIKDECDAVHEELAFKESELEETKLELEVEKERHRVELQEVLNDVAARQRAAAAEPPEENGKSQTTGTDSTRSSAEEYDDDTSLEEKGSDDYVKRLEDELELVTEQLIDAEQRLTRTEEELEDTKIKYERLENERTQQQRDAPDSSDTVQKLEEENQLRLKEEHRLKEELGLVHEELVLTQEELKASEEDVKQFEKKLENLRAEHRDEVNQLQTRLDQAETEARTASAEVDTLEKTMAAATEETVRLQTEISNLEAALENARKDQEGLVEELEAVNERFDASRQEAEKSAADRVRDEIKTETDKTVAELQEKMNSLSDTNSKLQAQLDEAETTLAAVRDQHTQQDQDSVAADSELVEKLQSQLGRTKEALDLKGQEMDELRSTFEGRVTQAEANVSKLEKELSTTKGKLAEAEANLIVIRREKQMAAGKIPKQKGKLAKASAIASVRKVERSSSSHMSVDSRDDVDLDRSMVETQSFSRRLRSVRRRRARSTSPTTPQRLIYRVEEEEKKTETLRKEYDSLKDQNRMEEFRAKRLEEDLKVLQTQLFSTSGDTAVVPQQMSRISTLASPEKGGDTLGDIRDVGESHVEELIQKGDPGAIADELRKLNKKSAKQREYNAQLLSKILSLQGNIQVYCRVRPMRISEIQAGNKNVVEALSETEIGCYDQRTNKWKSFGFDRVWGPDQSQNSVFQDVEPLALSVVDGYNACIFAYGQT